MILGGLVTSQVAITRSMLPVGREQGKQNEPFQRHRLAAKPDNLVGATPVHVWFSSATTDLPPPLTYYFNPGSYAPPHTA